MKTFVIVIACLLWRAIETLAIVFVCLLCGCSALTVAPKPPAAVHPSLDGDKADSGVVGRLPDGGYELRKSAVANYDRLISLGYGKQFLVPLAADAGITALADGNFEMDDEHVTDFGLMLSAWRADGKP